MTEVISRVAARAAGLKFYYTADPCSNGHLSERDVAKCACVTCARLKNVARHIEKREENIERSRRWQIANAERKLAYNRVWREENREKVRSFRARWAAANPEKVLASVHAQRARRKGADGRFTQDEVMALLEKQKGRCAACRQDVRKYYERDHIVPLSLGGTNWISNIQLLCGGCNRRKTGKHPIVWAQERGLLL